MASQQRCSWKLTTCEAETFANLRVQCDIPESFELVISTADENRLGVANKNPGRPGTVSFTAQSDL